MSVVPMTAQIASLERFTKTMRKEIAQVRHAAMFSPPYEALTEISGLYATWHAVQRVATALIQPHWREVKDVGLAWGIIDFVRSLPDGEERLRTAIDAALATWEREAEALAARRAKVEQES